MRQGKKKISKSQEIQYQWMQQRIKARELDTGASTVTYPRDIIEERPKRKQTQIQVNAGGNRIQPNAAGTVVSPVLYSLAYRKAWKQITDNYNRS